jgi:hypothetical protein
MRTKSAPERRITRNPAARPAPCKLPGPAAALHVNSSRENIAIYLKNIDVL